jgi:uncharacterized protein YcfJ
MSIQKSKTRVSLVFSIVIAVAGCATQGGGYNNTFGGMNTAEIAGGLIGAAAGAYGGSRIGHGATPYITGALGAAAGAWIGKSIASYLTQSAQQQMAEATQQAAQSGQPQIWNDPHSGTSGRAEVIQTSTTPLSASIQSTTANQSRPCCTVEQTITLSNGQKRKEQVTAYQGANGWEVI